MSASLPFRSAAPVRRRSHTVTLVLLGGIGLVGGLAAWDAWQRSQASSVSQPAPPPVSADQSYENNQHFPGAGYYHADAHAWYPLPYNYHDPARGYFAGGLWHLAPLALALSRSQPMPDAVAAANAALLARRQQEETMFSNSARSSGGGYRSNWFRTSRSGGNSYSSSGNSPSATGTSNSSVSRGGFGSSGHSSSGASS